MQQVHNVLVNCRWAINACYCKCRCFRKKLLLLCSSDVEYHWVLQGSSTFLRVAVCWNTHIVHEKLWNYMWKFRDTCSFHCNFKKVLSGESQGAQNLLHFRNRIRGRIWNFLLTINSSIIHNWCFQLKCFYSMDCECVLLIVIHHVIQQWIMQWKGRTTLTVNKSLKETLVINTLFIFSLRNN